MHLLSSAPACGPSSNDPAPAVVDARALQPLLRAIAWTTAEGGGAEERDAVLVSALHSLPAVRESLAAAGLGPSTLSSSSLSSLSSDTTHHHPHQRRRSSSSSLAATAAAALATASPPAAPLPPGEMAEQVSGSGDGGVSWDGNASRSRLLLPLLPRVRHSVRSSLGTQQPTPPLFYPQVSRLLFLALPEPKTGGERSLPTLLLGVKALLCLYEGSEEAATTATTTIPRLPALLHALLGSRADPTAHPLLLQWGDCASLLREEEGRARAERATSAPRLEVCGGQATALGALHVAGAFVLWH
jgi:hypothetical protein